MRANVSKVWKKCDLNVREKRHMKSSPSSSRMDSLKKNPEENRMQDE